MAQEPEGAPDLLGETLRVLVAAALADGIVQPEERTLLFELGEQLGFSVDTVRELVKTMNNDPEAVSRVRPPTLGPEGKRVLLTAVARIIAADRRILKEETAFLRRMTLAVGLDLDVVQEMMAEAARYE